MRNTFVSFITTLGTASLLTCGAVRAKAQLKNEYDLPAQSLGDSLRAIGAKSEMNVLFDPARIEGRWAPAVSISGTIEESLSKILLNTGITYKFLNEHTVVLEKAASRSTAEQYGIELHEETKSVAQVGSLPNHPQDDQNGSDSAGGPRDEKLTEVLVTAQKREERLQDVPIPVTQVSAKSLLSSNSFAIADFYSAVPSLNITTTLIGTTSVSIRGLAAAVGETPTTSITVDDVPVTASTSNGSGGLAIEIDPNIISSVEVLRGPQGTLYGASSIGGVLRYVSVTPSTAQMFGLIEAGSAATAHSSDVGYQGRGYVNVPVNDRFAFLVGGFYRDQPGYIDQHYRGDEARGKDDVNAVTAYGGHLSGLWKPSDAFSLKLNALRQRAEADGLPRGSLASDGLEQLAIKETGWSVRNTEFYSAVGTIELGNLEVTSATGYIDSQIDAYYDANVLAFFNPIFAPGSSSVPTAANWSNRKFSQELRVNTSPATWLDWQLGGFYTREKGTSLFDVFAANENGETINATLIHAEGGPTIYREYALFSNFTIKPRSNLDIQVGGRKSFNKQSRDQVLAGRVFNLFAGLPDDFKNVSPRVHAESEPFTFLITPRLKLSPDTMIYARFASGYRVGGPNPLASGLGLPLEYGPDKTINYELGTKTTMVDGKLFLDASVYRIDWNDLQTIVMDPVSTFQYIANVGTAKSEGVEFSIDARPLRGLRIGGWVSWNDAKLTKLPPDSAVSAQAGDRLPFSAHFSANARVDQEFSLTSNMTGFVGGTLIYFGKSTGGFSTLRDEYPAYTQLDLRAGVKFDDWSVNLFARNVTDEIARISGGVIEGGLGSDYFQYSPPRTVGLTISRSF